MRPQHLVLTTLTLIATACGGGSDDAPDASSEASATATTSAPTSATDPPATTSPPVDATSTTPPTTITLDTTPPPDAAPTFDELSGFAWTNLTETAPWSARAGLRVVEVGERLLLLGGRTPNQSTLPGDSQIWADVWASDDGGTTWEQLLTGEEPDLWPARAYFQAVVKDEVVYVIGGQDYGLIPNPYCDLLEQGLEPPPGLGIDPDAPCPEFLPTSDFFNDVWRSTDGVNWQEMTPRAPWTGRAGLSAAVLGDQIYVFAGSTNDDTSIIGPNGPARIYYNDVWRSDDGAEWELMTEAAPWEPRAGAATVVRDGRLFLLGGEDGFVCEPLPDCEPPYFNDVWSTTDGANWSLVTGAADWSPRPGHVCELVGNQIVCFGGFGLIANPTDMWASVDGVDWNLLPTPPWGSADPLAMKYDFDALAVIGGDGTERIITVGGDRETFDFADPENYLRVDNDVWVFELPG